eukprot:5680833-Prymnesium_polylepis.1
MHVRVHGRGVRGPAEGVRVEADTDEVSGVAGRRRAHVPDGEAVRDQRPLATRVHLLERAGAAKLVRRLRRRRGALSRGGRVGWREAAVE